MNKSYNDGLKTLQNISKIIKNNTRKKYVILPPIQSTLYIKDNVANKDILFGSQDCSQYNNGAFTGDISAEMIKKIGCKYVLIGHSERRNLYFEDSKVLYEKIKRASEQKLKIIFCVGERLTDYKKNKSIQFIIKQLLEVFDKKTNFKNIILAYEPIWAIGSNITPKAQEIDNIHREIKKIIQEKFEFLNIPILYGGSVKATNSAEIFSLKHVDGGLIGGASLIASEFCKIYDTL